MRQCFSVQKVIVRIDFLDKSSYFFQKRATLGGTMTTTAGIKEIKNNLSRFLARVKSGDEVLITERGKPIARIIKENQGENALRSALSPLIQQGFLVMPSRNIVREPQPRIQTSGKLASEMIAEDRR